jgi:hypothetical protein
MADADNYTQLNPGQGGDFMDETAVTYTSGPPTRKRPRVVLAGEGTTDIVPTPITDPTGTEPAILNRPIHSPYPGTLVSTLASVSSIAANTESTVVSYTVPAGKKFYFLGFCANGDIDALYKLYLGVGPVLSGRTSVAVPTVNINFPYSILVAAEGLTLRLKVTHYATGLNGNFEGTIIGYTL